MKKLISLLVLGSCIALSPAFAAKTKVLKVHPHKTAKLHRKHVKKQVVKARKTARKVHRRKSV